jgi:hypothetical protein
MGRASWRTKARPGYRHGRSSSEPIHWADFMASQINIVDASVVINFTL